MSAATADDEQVLDTTDSDTVEVTLHWRPSPLAVRLSVVAATALALAVVTRMPELAALAAPLLGALCAGATARRTSTVSLRVIPREVRCFEGDSFPVRITATGAGELTLGVLGTHGITAVDPEKLPAGPSIDGDYTVPRWGRFAPEILVSGTTRGRLLVATAIAHPMAIRVYPRPAPQPTPVRIADLPDRIGTHIARRRGEGLEFAGIRPYVPGDQLRSVNWAVSARRGRLHVTERLAERSADIVAVIDTYIGVDPRGTVEGPVRDALDLAAHGSAQLVQSALRRGDRAGVVALGGRLRWLGPDIGRRQFYRIIDSILDAYPTPADSERRSSSHTDLVPRGALPSGAVLVAFTPLLDGRIVLALNDVHMRGYPVIVVDVLRETPHAGVSPIDPLVDRVWRLGRGGMYRDFAILGIPVVPWRADAAMDEVLAPLARTPLTSRRPTR